MSSTTTTVKQCLEDWGLQEYTQNFIDDGFETFDGFTDLDAGVLVSEFGMKESESRLFLRKRDQLLERSSSTIGADENGMSLVVHVPTKKKIIAPLYHNIEARKLKVGDHIYRRLGKSLLRAADHHGVVIEISDKHENNKVMEMTAKGVKISTLTDFLHHFECRLVYYNTRRIDEFFQRAGSCHCEPASPVQEILARVKEAECIMNGGEDIYSMVGANCEEFAIWLKTGYYKGIKNTQLSSSCGRACDVRETVTSAISSLGTSTAKTIFANSLDDVALAAFNAARSAGTELAEAGGKEVGKELVKGSAKACAIGVGVGCGIAVALEGVLNAIRFWRYKNNIQYTWCDFKRDAGRSVIQTIACTAVGVSAMAIGWWAILPTVGLALLLTAVFHIFKVFDKKSHKEKVYAEYKLNQKSTLAELKAVRRKIRRRIRDDKLHPDKWPRGDNEYLKEVDYEPGFFQKLFGTKKSSRLEKFLWLTQIMDLLQKDIDRGHVSFDDGDGTDLSPLAIENNC